MNPDEIPSYTLEESLSTRPKMHFGNDPVSGILNGLIINCITTCETDEITFEITIAGDNDFILGIITTADLTRYWQQRSTEHQHFGTTFPENVKAVSTKFDVRTISPIKSEIHYSLDEQVINDTNIDYLKLLEIALRIAILNRSCEVITIDRRQKITSQNYFHFPEGIFYLFNQSIKDPPGKLLFKIMVDEQVGAYKYQIGLAYRSDWAPQPEVLCYWNDRQEVHGGWLAKGILDGMMHACKAYAEEQNLTTTKINRKKLFNGLILTCAVRGPFPDEKIVQKDVKALISGIMLHELRTQQDMTNRFFVRFDTSAMLNKMY